MKRCVMAAVAAWSFGAGLANAADRATDALLTCANESDDAQRLRCFDAVVANLRKAPAAPAATAAAAAPPPAAKAPSPAAAAASPAVASPPPASAPTAEQRFGARGEISPDRHEEIDELTGTVTAVGTKPHGELIVTLDNGQVWAEKQSGSKVKLKAGDTVKIERGAMGSYTLIANGRSSKVARIR